MEDSFPFGGVVVGPPAHAPGRLSAQPATCIRRRRPFRPNYDSNPPMPAQPSLEDRFLDNLRRLLPDGGAASLVVAFSGGLDSTVLLHLMRSARPGSGLVAAHFDHRMRDASAEDAAWAARQCADWNVDFESGVAERPLRGEAAARTARYTFLREVAARHGAWLATAHHADDQAETVLFRVLRGTGLHGLAGIRDRSTSGLVRPLLPFWREELEEYARLNELEWRTDATNVTLGPVRNRLRLRILPEIEASISSRARRNLVALAELAQESEQALAAAVAWAEMACVRTVGDASLLSRERLVQYDPALRARVVRKVLSTHGIDLSRAGTRTALEFITGAHSGRELRLPRGGRIRIEFDDARIELVPPTNPEDVPLTITEIEAGNGLSAAMRLGGRRFRVDLRHASEEAADSEGDAIWSERIPIAGLRFPLRLRGRRPGDSVHTAAGTKSIKKLMIERRVPLSERGSRPLLADAAGRILWVAGVTGGRTSTGASALDISIYDG